VQLRSKRPWQQFDGSLRLMLQVQKCDCNSLVCNTMIENTNDGLFFKKKTVGHLTVKVLEF